MRTAEHRHRGPPAHLRRSADGSLLAANAALLMRPLAARAYRAVNLPFNKASIDSPSRVTASQVTPIAANFEDRARVMCPGCPPSLLHLSLINDQAPSRRACARAGLRPAPVALGHSRDALARRPARACVHIDL